MTSMIATAALSTRSVAASRRITSLYLSPARGSVWAEGRGNSPDASGLRHPLHLGLEATQVEGFPYALDPQLFE